MKFLDVVWPALKANTLLAGTAYMLAPSTPTPFWPQLLRKRPHPVAWLHAIAGAAWIISITRALLAFSPTFRASFLDYSRSASAGPAVALLVVVVAPICEELLFRGALQPRIGLVLSAALFGAAHWWIGNATWIYAVWAGAVGGLTLGVIRARTTSIWPSTVTHALYNCWWLVTLAHP